MGARVARGAAAAEPGDGRLLTVSLLVLAATLGAWTGAAAAPASGPAPAPAGRKVPTAPDSVRLERAWPVMGTLFRAVARAPDSATALSALLAARDEVRRLDSLLSDYRDDSEVSRLARAAGSGRWTALSPETADLLRTSLRWAEATDGAFDPTVGPLVTTWGFRGASPHVPSPPARDSALRLVGWRLIELREGGREARLPRRGMALDFGAIGKGFALDRAAATMRRRGADAGMLDLGGNVLVFGRGPGADGGWPIGIRDPRRPGRVLGTLVLDSGSVATSGDYERFFEEDGVRYGHILDPRTGRPARGVLQVTVEAPDGTTADALSTALFVTGPVRGRRVLRDAPDARGATARWVVAGGGGHRKGSARASLPRRRPLPGSSRHRISLRRSIRSARERTSGGNGTDRPGCSSACGTRMGAGPRGPFVGPTGLRPRPTPPSPSSSLSSAPSRRWSHPPPCAPRRPPPGSGS